MNIRQTILRKGGDILNVYCTAGYPNLNSTVDVIKCLADNNVDLIELGLPYSDPLADGPTIQKSSQIALENGLTLPIIFEQVEEVRKFTDIPIIAMGYYNQFLQYGPQKFLAACQNSGIQGLIIPDLPMDEYEFLYEQDFKKYNIEISFLITPQTAKKRILQAERLSSAFVYVVSQTSITGNKKEISTEQLNYFERISSMKLESSLIGFGIHDNDTYNTACKFSNGAIIGSAFIRGLNATNLSASISSFIKNIR